ncbi:MAG: D-alanyl-D-alanine carboxypeptidase [Clostridiales bacterium]|jgi:D-alanyl-D-alanine carboxypeptidase (penicillin-binding protein 5/6)|nr:D-alanyl-D-alanine carboxypeptidase [Clostridiales bacterium]
MRTRLLCAVMLLLILLIASPYEVSAEEIKVDAKGAVLMDAGSGTILLEQNAHEKMYPASVTKIMTILIAMESLENGKIALDDRVVISRTASGMGGSQIYMEPEEVKTVEQLLKAVVVASGNDASVALAEHIAGTEEAFVQMMNQRAKELGMQNTSFVNSHGLHHEDHYTTAYDVALMSRELVKHSKIFDWTTIWMEDIEVGREGRFKTFTMVNTNKLLRRYEGADGLKTGSTSQAKYCMSATAVKGNMRLIAVVMGSPTSEVRFREAEKMFNYGFARYNSVPIAEKVDVIERLKVNKGKERWVNVRPAEDMKVLVLKGEEGNIEKEMVLPGDITAPVVGGEKVGELIVKQNGEILGIVDLVAEETVDKAGILLMLKRVLLDWITPAEQL